MIDNFSLLVSHGLLALLFWRLLTRPDLDKEPPAGTSQRDETPTPERKGWGRPSTGPARGRGRTDA